MDMMQWVALWSLIATQIGTAVGIYRYFDSRINRSYERMDENKREAEREFVKKENCSILHANTADNLMGAETSLVTRFDKLEKKVEEMFGMIIDMLKTK